MNHIQGYNQQIHKAYERRAVEHQFTDWLEIAAWIIAGLKKLFWQIII